MGIVSKLTLVIVITYYYNNLLMLQLRMSQRVILIVVIYIPNEIFYITYFSWEGHRDLCGVEVGHRGDEASGSLRCWGGASRRGGIDIFEALGWGIEERRHQDLWGVEVGHHPGEFGKHWSSKISANDFTIMCITVTQNSWQNSYKIISKCAFI